MSDKSKLIPFTIPNYEIKDVIGSGGFMTVYLAKWIEKDMDVALKVPYLKGLITLNESRFQDLINEAKIWMQLNHPNIVKVYDANVTNLPYIAMEYLEGGSLRKKLENGRIPWEDAVSIAVQIADALLFTHFHGVIHRDLKPENILFTKDGRPKITDWGLAKVLLSPTSTTSSEIFKGTVNYAAPEQLDPKTFGNVDWRTDIYQFGIVLYEMITGKTPFADDNLLTLITEILTKDPQSPKEVVEIPEHLNELILKMIAKNKEERPKGIESIMNKLIEVLISKSPTYLLKLRPEKLQQFLQTTDKGQMIDVLQNMIIINPEDKEAYVLLGLLKSLEDNFNEAVIAFSKVATIDKKYLFETITKLNLQGYTTWFSLAESLRRAGDYELTELAYMRALAAKSNNLQVIIRLGQIKYLQRDFKAALDWFTRAYELNPNNKVVCRYLGLSYYNLSELSKAVEYFKKALEIDPNYILAMRNLGICYIELKDFDNAIELYTKLTTLEPSYEQSWKFLGFAYYAKQEWKKAIDAFTEFMKKDAPEISDWANLIDAMIKYFKLKGIDGDRMIMLKFLGKSYLSLKKYDIAVALFGVCIEYHPEDLECLNSLAETYTNMNEIKKAIEYYEKVISVNPNTSKAITNLSGLYLKTRNYEKVIEVSESGLKINEGNKRLWNNKGVALYNLGHYQDAIDAYKRAIAIDANYEIVWRNLGLTYLKIKNYDTAIETLTNAVKLNPYDKYAWVYLGIAYYYKNDKANAKYCYEAALKIDSNFKLAKDNLEIL